jgi:hypothetical protein
MDLRARPGPCPDRPAAWSGAPRPRAPASPSWRKRCYTQQSAAGWLLPNQLREPDETSTAMHCTGPREHRLGCQLRRRKLRSERSEHCRSQRRGCRRGRAERHGRFQRSHPGAWRRRNRRRRQRTRQYRWGYRHERREPRSGWTRIIRGQWSYQRLRRYQRLKRRRLRRHQRRRGHERDRRSQRERRFCGHRRFGGHRGLWHRGLWHRGLWHRGLWHCGLWHRGRRWRQRWRARWLLGGRRQQRKRRSSGRSHSRRRGFGRRFRVADRLSGHAARGRQCLHPANHNRLRSRCALQLGR